MAPKSVCPSVRSRARKEIDVVIVFFPYLVSSRFAAAGLNAESRQRLRDIRSSRDVLPLGVCPNQKDKPQLKGGSRTFGLDNDAAGMRPEWMEDASRISLPGKMERADPSQE